MTDNKGDLISREALRNEVDTWGCNDYDKYDFLEAIDNAPTVEAIPTELHEKILDQTTGELLECQSNLRPQGEWITFPTNHSIIQCPECTALLNNLRIDVFKDKIGKMNYCPNCGASMKKGGAT